MHPMHRIHSIHEIHRCVSNLFLFRTQTKIQRGTEENEWPIAICKYMINTKIRKTQTTIAMYSITNILNIQSLRLLEFSNLL